MYTGFELSLPRRSQAKVGSNLLFKKISHPNHPLDLIQDLYVKEIKAYKAAPIVSTRSPFLY